MTQRDLELLNKIYGERRLYQGELHDHAKTGGTSDGNRTLEHWKGAMEALHMDFATILDHRQVRHMYLPEWEDGLFIGGTEPEALIVDSNASDKRTHYNMIFTKPEDLESLLEEFPEYEFTGGKEGHFCYPAFTRKRFSEVIDAVKNRGGLFVIPHPKQWMVSDDPLDFWYQDETGLEVFYISLDSNHTDENYKLWTTLLEKGKRLWACAGCDQHSCARNTALTSLYAEGKTSASFLTHLRIGDFTCGPIGIQMCIGETPMGGICSFEGQRLVVGVGKFHQTVCNLEHEYRLDILDDKGVVYSQDISCVEPTYVATDTKNCKFYRVEIFDVTRKLRIAIGNPIWNRKFYAEK